jgi:glutaredoxin
LPRRRGFQPDWTRAADNGILAVHHWNRNVMSLILYSRTECGLCDKAEALLAEGGLSSAYEKVDIDTDLELIDRYGDQIPVLFNQQTGEKLGWPFTASQVREMLDG